MKKATLARKHNFHGNPKGYTFEGPRNYIGAANLWQSGVKTSDCGNAMAKSLPKPPKKGKKI